MLESFTSAHLNDNAKSESWQDQGEIVKKPEEGHIISKKGYSKITLEGLASQKGNVKGINSYPQNPNPNQRPTFKMI